MNLDRKLDLRRKLKLFAVLVRYGLGTALGRLFGLRAASWPRALRLLLEDLGSTYLKLGQYLAIRFDLVPKEYCDELEQLFEGARPVDTTAIRQ